MLYAGPKQFVPTTIILVGTVMVQGFLMGEIRAVSSPQNSVPATISPIGKVMVVGIFN